MYDDKQVENIQIGKTIFITSSDLSDDFLDKWTDNISQKSKQRVHWFKFGNRRLIKVHPLDNVEGAKIGISQCMNEHHSELKKQLKENGKKKASCLVGHYNETNGKIFPV